MTCQRPQTAKAEAKLTCGNITDGDSWSRIINCLCSSKVNLPWANGQVLCQGVRMTTLTMKEEKRLAILERLCRDELTVVKAASILGVNERQCYRVKARVADQGAKGMVHGNRGRPVSARSKKRR